MRNEQRTTKLGSLGALLLFGVFAVLLLMILLSGADLYQSLTERDRANYDRHTAAQYLATRVRQADADGRVRVEEFHGMTALVAEERIGGSVYETRIYCYDGYLRELFATADYEAAPEDGEKVLPMTSLDLTCHDGLIRAELVSPSGDAQELLLHCRSGEEVTP